jgi:3-hydroxyisobutyrate dehydrogenase-like beta-hydroxyacid dehydrogenase
VTTIGLINPGQMGASIGAAVRKATVIWSGNGRSDATHQRAEDAGLTDCGSLESLVDRADMVLSVCPPHDAESVAASITGLGFKGLYADCNAISPDKTRRISSHFERFVDGGIIGGPAWHAENGTRLYLSGPEASAVAELFTDSPLHTNVISNEIGAASAIKMVFAAYTKGSTALLTAILGVAEKEGVRHQLEEQWGEAFTSQTHQRVTANSAKAWRFAGEMQEIASTFGAAGMPAGFHEAAAEVFEHLDAFKDDPADDISALLKELLD